MTACVVLCLAGPLHRFVQTYREIHTSRAWGPSCAVAVMRLVPLLTGRARSSATACVLLLMCADPPPAEDMGQNEPQSRPIDDGDMELIGESIDWPFDPPWLRAAMYGYPTYDEDGFPIEVEDNHPEVVNRSIGELRRRRLSDAKQRAMAVSEAIQSAAGLTDSECARCLRLAPRLATLPVEQVHERLELLLELLPRAAVRKVVQGAPQLLQQASLRESLPARLRALVTTTGLAAERVASTAPALLLFSEAALLKRADELRATLPELELPSILRRAPRLLHLRAETIREAMDELVVLLPEGSNVRDVVQRQPTLLLASRPKLAAKLGLLRELCSDAEWASLVCSASLGRALTASTTVIERLRDAPRPADGGPRGVVKLLLMSRAEYDGFHRKRAGAKRVSARPGPQPAFLRWPAPSLSADTPKHQ